MSTIDTINSKSNLDCITDDLFTELTPEAAEVFQGGGTFKEQGVSFINDYILHEKDGGFFIFSVPKGGTISLRTNTTSNKGYRRFSASIVNVGTWASNTKTVDIGSDLTTWTNVRGGWYAIRLQDPDSDRIEGDVAVRYS